MSAPVCACCGDGAGRDLIRVIEPGVYEILTWNPEREAHDITRLDREKLVRALVSEHGYSPDEAMRSTAFLDKKAAE